MFSLVVVIVGLIHGSKESSQSLMGQPRLWGPSEALVTKFVEFYCELLIYPQNETILLQLYKDSNRVKPLAEYTSLDGEAASFPLIAKPRHEGDLVCVAKAQNNSNIEPTASFAHYLKVITKVQGAAIEIVTGSVEMFEGATLELNCTITDGNYVSYKWLLNNKDVHYNEHLMISRTTPADSGSYVCVATNSFNKTENFTAMSLPVNITVKGQHSPAVISEDSEDLSSSEVVSQPNISVNVLKEDSHSLPEIEIVPVAGPVTIHYDYDFGENYAVIGLRFYCKAAKGSFPRYHWFLNNTLLTEEYNRESFYRVFNQPPEQSILLLSVGWSSAGTYRCEVSDSFNNSTVISSKKLYLDQEAVNRLPLLVVAVVFGSFTFLILLVSLFCCMGVFIRRRLPPQKSPVGWEMNRVVMEVDSNLDLSEYNEDPEVASREDDFDQESLVSVDEWPQIAKQKKALGGEPVEED
ncbi:uncharacterized protein V6R79_020294 [Siganus canaliculatus]